MHTSFEKLGEVFFALCKTADTPLSLAAWLRFKHRDPSVLDMDVKHDSYTSPHAFALDYQVVSFLKKFKGFNFGIDTKAAALSNFAKAEARCAETNRRLTSTDSLRHNSRVVGILSVAARKIASVLGPFDISQANRLCKWGPGATASLKGMRVRRDLKHCELPMSTTHGAVPLIRAHLECDPLWFEALTGFSVGGPFCVLESCFAVVDANRVITVHKNAKTDRTIAAEPTANSFLQQGVGRLIRRKLKRVGVDLDDQSRNQELALRAWGEGLATLDLSAASDTVSKELVYQLLPLDWAIYLDLLRSPYGVLPDGDRIRYEKWSSMGNAYTFELESLIFWGLSQAVKADLKSFGPSAVYGDDIIVPADCAPLLVEVLEFCGFSINIEKSFISGPFYESCGKHYFRGFDVTPFYQKEVLDSLPEQIRFLNRIKRWLVRLHTQEFYEFFAEYKVWLCALRVSQKEVLKYAIPNWSVQDGGVLLSDSEWSLSGRQRRYCYQRRGYFCTVLAALPRKRRGYAMSLYSQELRSESLSKDPCYGMVEVKGATRYDTRKTWITS